MAPRLLAVPMAARPATPAPTIEDLRRGHLAAAVDLAGEEDCRIVVRRLDHRTVAAGCWPGEHISRVENMRGRCADGIHRQGRHPLVVRRSTRWGSARAQEAGPGSRQAGDC
jgi:L-rhamnose isomerase